MAGTYEPVAVLGAAAQATHRIPLMTYVTCPIRRYHPAVVAQKAATMQLLSDGRFTLGLGAGVRPSSRRRACHEERRGVG
jgi:alkanesulfonate monooxygenase SsuD/methylene tetrahydromethanopterin reductase-like flavin-dependent oxidoreductase (luciferase family)